MFLRRIGILSLLFLLAGLPMFWEGYHQNQESYSSRVISDFGVDGWSDRDIHNDPRVLDVLRPDAVVFKDYRRQGEPPVTLYIGFYDTLEKSKLSHAPEVCFTGQGWIMKERRKIKVDLDSSEAKVNGLFLERSNDRLLAFYWYQAGDDVYDDLFKMKLSLLYRKIKSGLDDKGLNTFIRISTPVGSNHEEAVERLKLFFTPISEIVDNQFFDMNSKVQQLLAEHRS